MSLDWNWISNQLNQNELVTPRVRDGIRLMLEAFDGAVEARGLTDDEQRIVLDFAQKLALRHAILFDAPEEVWEDVVPGYYSVGDIVRVRADAYAEEPASTLHNGKRGRVVAAHRGKPNVLYDGETNTEKTFYHEVAKLERLR